MLRDQIKEIGGNHIWPYRYDKIFAFYFKCDRKPLEGLKQKSEMI